MSPTPKLTPPLRALGLRKRYGQTTVVEDVGLSVRPGEVLGLLGPNGAGKTTTFYMLVGLVRPDGGEIRLGKRSSPANPSTPGLNVVSPTYPRKLACFGGSP